MCNALTVTKRESAPLPERLCERIAYCAILLTVYEADYSVVVAQSEGADHRYYSTPEMQNILLQNAVSHAVRKAKNFADGATDTIFSGSPVLINLMSDFVLDKTKATAEGRQWVLRQIKLERITNNATFAAGGQSVTGKKFRWGYSCSLALRRWSSSRATVTSCPISSAALTPIFSTCASASSEETRGFSPLPSAWRRAISPRMAVTMNPALLSPSSFTDSIPSITSWGTLIVVICDFAFLYTDIVNHQLVMCISLYTKVRYKNTCNVYHHNIMYISHCDGYVSHNVRFIKTTKPGSALTLTGLLTKPLTGVTIMAGTQHTPRLAHTQTAFVWRFLALSAGESQIIHVTAWTEREARNRCPSGCVAVFAARIRQEVHHA